LEPDDPTKVETKILDAIDCKREKASFSKDKCKYLLKMVTEFDPVQRKVVIMVLPNKHKKRHEFHFVRLFNLFNLLYSLTSISATKWIK